MNVASPSLSPSRKLPLWVWCLLACSSLVLLSYTCYRAAVVTLTFDEIWSLNAYAKASWANILAFKPLSANNHIGNSLLMKLCLQAFGDSALSLRLPNLLAHGIFLAYAIAMARRLRQGVWVLLAFFLLNFHPYLLDFFSLARGYGLAMAMVMAALYHLFAFRENAFSRHIISNIIFAGLSVVFNLSFLHFFVANALVMVLLIYSHSHAWNVDLRQAIVSMLKRLAPLLIVSLALYLFLRKPVQALVAANELYYGGHSGFWSDTVTTLAHALLYKIDYWHQDLDLLLKFGLGSLFCMFIAFGIELSERQWKWRESPGMLTLMLMLVPTVTCTVQHFTVGSPFLIYRTALFLLPIYMLGLVWLLRTIAKVPAFRKGVIAVSLLITAMLSIHNFCALNLTHCAEWSTDADTATMLQDLKADRLRRGISGPSTLGMSWQLRPGTNYYRTHQHLDWLPEIPQASCPAGMDYYFLLGGEWTCKLPVAPSATGECAGCTLIQSYPISNTTLWRVAPTAIAD